MKNVTRFLVFGLFAMLVFQLPPALALHKPGHIPPTGTCRKDPCPCSKEVEEKIQGLIGRLRALKEVADMTRKEYNAAFAARDNAWRSFGHPFSGSGAKYVNSLIGMASISPATSWSGWINAGIGMAQDVGQGSVAWDTWVNAGTQVVGDDKVIEKMVEINAREAAVRAADYLRRTGDHLGAKEIYYRNLGRIPDTPINFTTFQNPKFKTGVSFVSAVNNVNGCVKATEDMVNDLSNYWEQKREAKQLKKQLKQIDDQIEAILKELEELRKGCASKGNATGESQGSFSGERETPKGLTDTPTLSLSDEDDGPNEAALQKLSEFQGRLDGIQGRFRERFMVPFSPFLVNGLWKEMDSRLVREIARGASPYLEPLSREIEEALALGRQIKRDLKL